MQKQTGMVNVRKFKKFHFVFIQVYFGDIWENKLENQAQKPTQRTLFLRVRILFLMTEESQAEK